MVGDALGHFGIELREPIQQRNTARLKLVSLGAPGSEGLGFDGLPVARLQPGQQSLQAIAYELRVLHRHTRLLRVW